MLYRFYAKLDVVLNEDVLIGKSRVCQEALRAPAASTLAELIVHVRSELTLQQIQRIVYLFSRYTKQSIPDYSSLISSAHTAHKAHCPRSL